jgi:dihydropteroate synthase
VDTYHPETIFKVLAYRQDHQCDFPIIWNDVSGKFDDAVRDYLKTGHRYIFCHNLAPTREQTVEHRNYIQEHLDLADYFGPYIHPQVIFDPCLGFSKSFQQNWDILENFNQLTSSLNHAHWLLGFSRKSFLRQKYQTDNLAELDQIHVEIVRQIHPSSGVELWIRTHRPEAI